jgi:hypothetical protein
MMADWLRLLRGAVKMGLGFAMGVGVVASAVTGIVWLLNGLTGGAQILRFAAASVLWAFPIGMAFSGFLALTARGRSFEQLSLPRFAALGAGGGLLLYGVLALNAWQAWTPLAAVVNLGIFVVLGAGSATATLLVARRARPSIDAREDPRSLGKG